MADRAARFQSMVDGMELAGDYPIHIVVQNARVRLIGVVANDGDKNLAGMKARQVPGSSK